MSTTIEPVPSKHKEVISINDATVREVSLETGGLSAESELGGVRGNVIPKDGGNAF